MFVFILFLLLCSSLLLFDLNSIFIGIILLLCSIFIIIKNKIFKKKTLISFIIIFLFGTLYKNINFYDNNKTNFVGIVLKRKENYFVFFDGINKYYVYSKNKQITNFDILRLNGRIDEIDFEVTESSFDFNKYLFNNNIKKKINIKNIEFIFDNKLSLENYKKGILSNYNGNAKIFISSILFNDLDYDSTYIKTMKQLGLLNIFILTGGLVSFFFLTINKLLEFCMDKKYINITSLCILSPYLLLNITKVSILRVFLTKLLSILNFNILNNKFSKLETNSIIAIILLIINPGNIYNLGFIIAYIFIFIFSFINLEVAFSFKYYFKKIFWNFIIFLPFFIYFNNSFNIFIFLLNIPLLYIFKFIALTTFIAFLGLNLPLYNSFLNELLRMINLLDLRILNINLPPFNQYLYIFYYLGIIFLIYFLEINIKTYKVIYISVLSTFLLFYSLPLKNLMTIKIDFINVGQGDSTLIRIKNTTYLIDTGGGLKYKDLAFNSLIPFFKKERIYKIDYLFITHYDEDHVGALKDLSKNFKIINILDYNSNINIDNDYIKIKNLNNLYYEDENDKSLVLKIKLIDKIFLFMGDSSIKVENDLMNIYSKEELDCDYIKVGHHGSKTSTSDKFIKYITPDEAIISCGKNNIYKFPHKEVINTLKKNKVKIRKTSLEGTISYSWII